MVKTATTDTVREDGPPQLVGGALCLDFANTVGGTRERPTEKLPAYEDFVRWGARAGAVDPEEAEPLLARAAAEPEAALAVHARAIELREALYRIFVAVIADAAPAQDDLAVLNGELARALPHLRIEHEGDGFVYRFAPGSALERPLWPIARSAAELLDNGEIDRLKECSSEDCTWLFVDQSKNRSRRWCDMKDCGNRAKARRHYHRQKRARG